MARGLQSTSLLLALALAACGTGRQEARLDRLALRVDSLARTLTAVVAAQRGPGPAVPETADVTIGTLPVAGSPAAPITIVEFTDYQCPFCGRHAREILPVIRRDYIARGLVRYVVRDLPLPIHANARPAARLMRCVGRLDSASFWPLHDSLFHARRELSELTLTSLGRQTHVAPVLLHGCLADPATEQGIAQDVKDATAAGLRGTPAFVIGLSRDDGMVRGRTIAGAYPMEVFRQVLDSLVAAEGQPNRSGKRSSTLNERGENASNNLECRNGLCLGPSSPGGGL